MLLFATGGLTFLSYPLYDMMLSSIPYHVLIGQGGLAIFIGSFMGVIGVVMVELFKAEVRVSAVSVSFNLSFAIFGGTAPIVATWLIHTTHNDLALAWYLSLVSLISLITVLTIPETYKQESLE